MPDQLAHIRFARRVLAAAEPSVRARVCGDSMAFRCGTFGPDPLFNDPLPSGRAEGLGLHRKPGRVALERMRDAVKSGMPWAADYAAGFFCHYALDRMCHPELMAMAERGEAEHVAVETAYDRVLLARSREDMPARITLSLSQLQAAATMYEGITPSRFRAAAALFAQPQKLVPGANAPVYPREVGRINSVPAALAGGIAGHGDAGGAHRRLGAGGRRSAQPLLRRHRLRRPPGRMDRRQLRGPSPQLTA